MTENSNPNLSSDTPAQPEDQANSGAVIAKPKPKYGFVRRLLRTVFWSFLLTFSILGAILAATLAWFDSDSGRYWLVDAINRSGVAKLAAIEGSFWSELQIKQLHVKTDAVTVDLDYGVLRWEPYALMLRDLSLPLVSLGKLAITTAPTPPNAPPTTAPDSLRLPFGIHLEQLKIALLDIDGMALRDIDASISSNGRFHRLNLKQLRLPQGNVAAALNITGKAPFHSGGSFIFAGQLEEQDIRAFGKVEGPLRQLMVEATIEHPHLTGHTQLQADVFAPYSYQMISHGEIQVKGLNPALWHPAAPQAALDLAAQFKPVKNGLEGQINIQNHQLGPIDQHKLPLKAAKLQFSLHEQVVHVDDLLLQFDGAGDIRAQGKISQGQLALKVAASHLDPQRFWSPQPAGDMNGELELAGPWLAPGVKGEINDLARKANLKLDVGWINPDKERRLAIRHAQLSRGQSHLVAKGEFDLLSQNKFAIDAELQKINPAEFSKVPVGSISGKANLKGALKPIPVVDLAYELAQSEFNHQPLAGAGALTLDAERISKSDFWLSLGANKISAKGSLGRTSDQLDLNLMLPNLSVIGPQFQGRAEGVASLSGSLTQPKISARLDINQLSTPFDVKLQQGHLDISASSDLQGPIVIAGHLQKMALGTTQIDQADLSVKGTMKQHDVSFKLSGKHEVLPLQVDLHALGGLIANTHWQGQILNLAGTAGLPFSLKNTPNLTLSADEVLLSASTLGIGQSQLLLKNTHWKNGVLDSQGQVQNGLVAEWLNLAKIKNPTSDLILAGEWQVKKTDVLNAQLNLQRVSGDVLWREDAQTKVPLTLKTFALNGQVVMNKLQLKAQVQTEKFGQLAFAGDTMLDLEQGGLADQAALNASLKGNLPDLSVLGPLLGGDVKVAGKAQLDIERRGPLVKPQLGGYVLVDGFSLTAPSAGVQMKEGVMELALSNQQIELKTFKVKGPRGGDLKGSGLIAFNGNSPSGGAKLVANKFTLISKPDMLLVLSGQGGVEIKDGALQVSGDFKADEGDIQFQATDTPSLSSDVRVVGRESAANDAKPVNLHMQLDFDLGDNFQFRGYGLDSRLAGKLRLRAQPKQLMKVTGTVNTEDGEYKAYGQKLEIERGILSFQGPIDNPNLDILAIRRNQAVEAGVKVQGSAYSPRVTLYSEPSVPDAEKISWLLFGHGSENMEKSDSALVLQLLNAMAGSGGTGLSDEILGNFGIDEVGYKSKQEDDGSTTQVVTVSKRLTKNLRVAVEKSFNGLSDAVSFTLQLSRHWSVISRIGVDESSLDVNYTLSFD
ncbi:translocation/assembly module TamB domain-containing protein [Chitinibacter bivalviorum]|uniref:Translocation/assembly module TamB domain-containing protein n=1 Tax=Chitinibacter bivalviorum TaxID=2739434 RepID=A0A7H9BHW9_9NEIS|nr:translocation/assembly module TamB domain-containing protein [Chitinibacter bivalviorum]QLG87866.1 translocation/assembly module TamB domain-containing protein [Chitinibacter bivalviorum]